MTPKNVSHEYIPSKPLLDPVDYDDFLNPVRGSIHEAATLERVITRRVMRLDDIFAEPPQDGTVLAFYGHDDDGRLNIQLEERYAYGVAEFDGLMPPPLFRSRLTFDNQQQLNEADSQQVEFIAARTKTDSQLILRTLVEYAPPADDVGPDY